MSAIQEFRSALKNALKPQSLEPRLWQGVHRVSPNLLEINTQPLVTVLYIKESNKPRGFWGLTKNRIDSLNNANVNWFAVLLHQAVDRGYLLTGQEISRLVSDGTFKLGRDGDYKVNGRPNLETVNEFRGIPELVSRVL